MGGAETVSEQGGAGSVDDRAAGGQDGAMAIRRRDVVDDRGGAEAAGAADAVDGPGSADGPGGQGGAEGPGGADRAIVMEGLARFHYLRWDELPDQPVFLDELVAIVNGMHAPVPYGIKKKKCFTTSMASNYVKQKLTPPPLGKRYAREHISKILFAATLKIVFNAEDVAALTELEYAGRDCAEVHDRIAEAFDTGMRRMMENHVRNTARPADASQGASRDTSQGASPASTAEPASHETRSADATQGATATDAPQPTTRGAHSARRASSADASQNAVAVDAPQTAAHEASSADESHDAGAGADERGEVRIDALLADAFSSKVLALALILSR